MKAHAKWSRRPTELLQIDHRVAKLCRRTWYKETGQVKLASEAIDAIADRLAKPDKPAQEIMLAEELIVGSSCGADPQECP